MIYVIAKSELKPGYREEYIKIAKANIPNVLAEEGCIFYTLTEECDAGFGGTVNPDIVTFVECWESVEHLHKHLSQPHMEVFKKQIADMRVSSELRVVQPV